MLKINGKEIENVKFNGVDLDKVVINGVNVFEKTSSQENTITMRTLKDNVRLHIQTKDNSPCEVWNAGNKIGVLNNNASSTIPIPNKNEDVIIKRKEITSFSCDNNQLTSLNLQGLTALQYLECYGNQLTSLDVQGLTALQRLDCNNNRLTAQAFTCIFDHLLIREKGQAVLYSTGDNNYKDFTRPPELVEAFNGAKARGWKFYKNDISDSNLI